MSLLTHLVSVMVATNSPAVAISNEIQTATGITVPVTDPNDPVAVELRDVMIADDAALADVNEWMRANDAATGTNKVAPAVLNKRIMARLDEVRTGYKRFLQNHPDNAHGYLAYGSFLNEIGDEDGAKTQYENSKQLDPKNPAVWNNLANYYGEYSPVTNAFAYYAEAIRLNPNEPVYYQNFATTVYLFRKDAREYYHIAEQQVFDKALGLYRQAMQLAPDNFVLATDFAESYYGIKPLRTNDALVAWTNALKVARTDAERQGVEIHLARVKISAGRFDEARAQLAAVTNAAYADLKKRLEKSLIEHEHPTTNDVPDILTNSVVATTNPVVAVTNNFRATNNPLRELTNGLPGLPRPSLREQKP